jgi:hypothetical protein
MVAEKSRLRSIIVAAASGAAGVALYKFVLRPWHLSWGATDEETLRSLPGDEIILNPRINATHALTIDAPPQAIWPWLVQMGQGRGGMYTYDWIENLMGLNMKSTDRILPEYQYLQVGDIVPFEPGGNGPPVVQIEPDRALVLGAKADAQSEGPFKLNDPDPNAYFAISWLFFLNRMGEDRTRLIERFRLDWYPPNLKNAIYMYAFLEPGAFLMERGMLLGIKRRAEAYHAERMQPLPRR